jgi:hypothetical protein
MCEQEVKELPYTLIDDIPEHNGHTQQICEECHKAVNGIEDIDKSEDLQKHPLRTVKND